MKKILIILAVIITITSLLFAFAGCGEGFSKNSIRTQITDNLGWHENGMEECKYDVFKDGKKVGEYMSTVELFKNSVEIVTSNENVKPQLENFTGYKFTTSMTAELDGKKFVRETESYASLRMEPKLSYVKTTEENTVEIVTSYTSKKTNVTYIQDGNVTTASAKLSNSAFVVDNSFIYQFARVTTLSSALSIVVPTYNAQNSTTSNASFSCSYSNGGNVILSNQFVLNKKFNETITSGETTSGIPVNSGTADNSGDIVTTEDESGNINVEYPYTLTSSIPVTVCKFTTSKTFPASGSISCMLSTSPLKMQNEALFANRVVVRFVEDTIEYNLTDIKYTKR